VLNAALVVVAGLVGVGVVGLIPVDDASLFLTRQESPGPSQPVPAEPRAAPGLEGRAATVAFERSGAELPGGLLGPWDEVAGGWEASDGTARIIDSGRRPNLAVIDVPDGSTTVQVTLDRAHAGAGIVTSYESSSRYVALIVDPSGQRVTMVRVEGAVGRGTTLVGAFIDDGDGPLVLALRRDGDRVGAFANGLLLGRRVVRDPGGRRRVGLVSGPGSPATAVRFDDLVVA